MEVPSTMHWIMDSILDLLTVQFFDHLNCYSRVSVTQIPTIFQHTVDVSV